MAFFSGIIDKVFTTINGSGGGVLPIVEDSSGVGRNLQGNGSGHAYVDGKTRAASAIAVHATIASDTDLTGSGDGHCRRIIVGTSGDLEVVVNGDTVIIPSEIIDVSPALDIEATAIKSANTTAAKILVMW